MIMRGNPTPEFFDYIACKFIVNLPKEELVEDRIGFHFQKAYFYYLDTQGLAPQAFNGNKNQRSKEPKQNVNFYNQLLRVVSCSQLPRLTGSQMVQLIQENYCTVPVSGIIILNLQQTHAVIVESKSINVYGFPKGKINQGQTFQQCAVREVKQQIGIKVAIDSKNFIQCQKYSKTNGKNLAKRIRFYLSKVQQSCIVQRQSIQQPSSSSSSQSLSPSSRNILHSQSQIKSINWIKLSQISKLIDKQLFNSPSKLAYFQLIKKLNKNYGYKEKKSVNPLEEFKGFDQSLGMIFSK